MTRIMTLSARCLVRFGPIAVAFVLSCNSSNHSASDGGAPSNDAAGRCPRDGTVPPDLRDVERSGEGLVSATFGEYPARTPDWGRAGIVFGLLKNVWNRTKSECPDLPAAQVSALDDAETALKSALDSSDQRAATTAANKIGLTVPELFDYFHPDIPIEVVRMDASFRQVGLDAHFGDWTAEGADVMQLSTDWASSSPAVSQRAPTCHRVGGTDTVVGDIDQTVANLQKTGASMDTKTAETESENGALEIDTLELLFDCPPDGMSPKTGLGSSCSKKSDCASTEVCDESNKGGTCAPDPSAAHVGDPCSTTVDCGSDPRAACNTEAGDAYPGGYCGMEPCDDVQVCPPGATCLSPPHETPGCWKACKQDKDCRTAEGYVCQLFPINPNPTSTEPAGFGPSATACGFPCKDDDGCTSPLKCNAATGKCQP